MAVIAVAALSARMLAAAAAGDGHEVIALDLFGDVDTRRVAREWWPLGEVGSLQIDAGCTLAALRALARRGDVSGWVAGSGFEGRPELLAEAATLLPLIGMPAPAVARVRDPATFFGFLAAQDIAHPPVLLTPGAVLPGDAGGPWLIKDAGGCGGWQVRRAGPSAALPAQHYLQRQVDGVPMSATFIGNGREALLLGFNELLVCALGERPFVFCGVLGPVTLPAAAASRVRRTVAALTVEFALQGLCSLDFMLDGEQVAVLEINPRPPASMGLYASWRFAPAGGGPLSAHLRACLHGELLRLVPAPSPSPVHGFEIVFARQRVQVDEALAEQLVSWPNGHDLPCSGSCIAAGEPLCSLSAAGATAPAVRAALQSARLALLDRLESAR